MAMHKALPLRDDIDRLYVRHVLKIVSTRQYKDSKNTLKRARQVLLYMPEIAETA